MDAKESVFKNSGAAIFGKDRSDILYKKYNLKEKQNLPAPGHYNSAFSEFSGVPSLPKVPAPVASATAS